MTDTEVTFIRRDTTSLSVSIHTCVLCGRRAHPIMWSYRLPNLGAETQTSLERLEVLLAAEPSPVPVGALFLAVEKTDRQFSACAFHLG